MSGGNTTGEGIDRLLGEKAQQVNGILERILASESRMDSGIREAVTYVLRAPGKRVRSALVLWSCEVVSGRANRNAEIAAAAIEMVHTYSLVHDDLPAMDDDYVRRGQPTCHKAFDEATAILTGDALLTLAFEILSKEIDTPEMGLRLVCQLAEDAGPAGMIAGQMADLRAENGVCNKGLLEYIHTNKTAKMFRCAAAMGAICGGARKDEFDSLCEYGLKIGLGFQIADDILDVSASSQQLGKTAGKDLRAAKCTYPAVAGVARSKELERELAEEAVEALEVFGERADILRQLARALLERTK
ncbi:MAG: polyprenyl synthetase family protein [Phycisphaerales bacterium]|nr:MAG: polyprenyl synthetase family protein [Phycisphaerales bacterium]